MIALTAAISDRFESDVQKAGVWNKAKAAAALLWRPAARVGLAAVTVGATELAGNVSDAAINAAGKLAADKVDEFWKKEDGKKGAMAQFASALEELTGLDTAGKEQKLIVVVDELDRCRPDYALSVLEVIKHFFEVPNVHFILGINLVELENIIRTRYGNGVDARNYLQKFLSVTLSIPEKVKRPMGSELASIIFFRSVVDDMAINPKLVEDVLWHLEKLTIKSDLSIRDTQKILTEMALIPQVPNSFDEIHFGYRILISGLIIQKIANPEFYGKCRNGFVRLSDVEDAFGVKFSRTGDMEHHVAVLHRVWASCLEPLTLPNDDGWRGMWGNWGLDNPEAVIPRMFAEYLDVVKLSEPTS